MQAPVRIALVGRPNVGKSALFNKILGKRVSIVEDIEGVTRDRIYARGDFFGRPFELIDTGGLTKDSAILFHEEVRAQTELAIAEADVLILVVDGTMGITLLDEEIAKLLLKQGKRVVLAINKMDRIPTAPDPYMDYYQLGFKNMQCVSAQHGRSVAELMELAIKDVVPALQTLPPQEGIKVAIVGRPNVGKSTLINFLAEDNRLVVSPIAGTTRDPIDVVIENQGEKYIFVDTAGIKRKNKEIDTVDKFAHIRTEKTIDAADVCILVLDSTQGMTAQEKKIANYIEAQGKGCILLFNKWDLVHGFRMEHCLKAVHMEVPFLQHCPTIFGSALGGRNMFSIFGHIKAVFSATTQRVSTGKLNRFVELSLQKYHPPMIQGKRLRIYYLTQVGVSPPQFVLFVNYKNLMADSYQKYLINQFRDTFGFTGVPLRFELKEKLRRTKEARLEQKAFDLREQKEIEAIEEVSDAFFLESEDLQEEIY